MKTKIISPLILLICFLVCHISTYGGDTKVIIPVKPKLEGTVTKPRAPSKNLIVCTIDGDILTVTTTYPTIVTAEVYVSSSTETVVSYFSGEAAETHTFYVEPQNDYLTIDIEVDGRMFTGEFFH